MEGSEAATLHTTARVRNLRTGRLPAYSANRWNGMASACQSRRTGFRDRHTVRERHEAVTVAFSRLLKNRLLEPPGISGHKMHTIDLNLLVTDRGAPKQDIGHTRLDQEHFLRRDLPKSAHILEKHPQLL